MSVHRIRLQGPWEVIPPGRDSSPQEIRVPISWRELFNDTSGTATFSRLFNAPTNLSADDRILIRLPEQAGTILFCSLNGQSLEPQCPETLTYEATRQLRDFNRLEIQISFDPAVEENSPGGLWQPVLLEIHSSD